MTTSITTKNLEYLYDTIDELFANSLILHDYVVDANFSVIGEMKEKFDNYVVIEDKVWRGMAFDELILEEIKVNCSFNLGTSWTKELFVAKKFSCSQADSVTTANVILEMGNCYGLDVLSLTEDLFKEYRELNKTFRSIDYKSLTGYQLSLYDEMKTRLDNSGETLLSILDYAEDEHEIIVFESEIEIKEINNSNSDEITIRVEQKTKSSYCLAS